MINIYSYNNYREYLKDFYSFKKEQKSGFTYARFSADANFENSLHDHPLFRFTLELFSIIPKRCIDIKTNNIICSSIPTSGYYEIKEKTPDSVLFEKRNSGNINGVEAPQKIRFKYIQPEKIREIIPKLDSFSIIAASDWRFSRQQMKSFEQLANLKFHYS